MLRLTFHTCLKRNLRRANQLCKMYNKTSNNLDSLENWSKLKQETGAVLPREKARETDDNWTTRAKCPWETIRSTTQYVVWLEQKGFSRDVLISSPTPPFSTSPPPSSFTQHLVLVKMAHWISRIKRTCREHSILGTTYLSYLDMFTTLHYRVRSLKFCQHFHSIQQSAP